MNSKVRIACRRCRTKRIKCDGSVPACSNCQKAGEPCIDVDGRNNAISIPRDFAANARARIEWLEEQIKKTSPEIDLNGGPQVDFSFLDGRGGVTRPSASSPSPESSSAPAKRTYSAITDQQPQVQEGFADEARSVALDLGLLTLNSDSRQTHYLGTSSGRLFTSLIGVGSPETPGRSKSTRTPSISSQPSPGKSGPVAHVRRIKEAYRLLIDSVRKTLPPEDDARTLLEIYFRNIHIDHPFLHPESIISAVEALYHCAAVDPVADIGFNGWVESIPPFAYNGGYVLFRNTECTPISVFTAIFHVYMVFTLAATVSTRQRSFDFAPNQFYRVAMSAGQHCFSDTSLASLQATLLLAVYSLLGPAELNIWTLTYIAMAHCVDFGLHRTADDDSSLSKAARLTRQMVFFSVYHLDRSIAAIQGRPLGIRDETFDLGIPILEEVQTDSSSIRDKVFAPDVFPTSGLAFALHRFKLDPIISEIKLLFYHLPSQINAYAWPSDHHASQTAIRQRLEDWRVELSKIAKALRPGSEDDRIVHRNYELKLASQYFAAMILLHQPSQVIPQPSQESLLTCYQCARRRLNNYNDLYHADSYYQSWRSVQGIFSSGATMIYCLWTSSLVRNTIPIADAMSDLRTCTNLLSVGGEWWPSVKKGKESFSRAMDALLKKLDYSKYYGRGESDTSQRRRAQGPSSENAVHMPNACFSPLATTLGTVPGFDTERTDFQGATPDISQYPHPSGDFSATDWTILDDPPFPHHGQNFSEQFWDTSLGGPDSTVEAFIAEFMRNDTAWNPF